MTLANALTINVEVWAVDMTATGGLNAMCIPGIIQVLAQGPKVTLTRPQAKLTGDILNPHDPAVDLVVVMDTNTHWVYGAGNLGEGQFSLRTTIMHELCHGLGFLGLCYAAPPDGALAGNGTYSAANTLLPILEQTVGLMVPKVTIPDHFFPGQPVSGFAVMTPFAKQFVYTGNPPGVKGKAADDYTAFLSAPGSIRINIAQQGPNPGLVYVVETGTPFQPFTTCDHITGKVPGTNLSNLMNKTTAGLNLGSPDASSRNILKAIGWNIP